MLKLFKLLLALGIIGLLVWAGWVMFKPVEKVVETKRSVEDYLKFIAQHNLGLAQLENQEFVGAIEQFEQLAAALPDEEMPVRNLAIARTLQITVKDSKLNPAEDPQQFKDAVQAAAQAIEKLRERKTPEGEIIAGELALYLQDYPDTGVEMERAIDLFSRAMDMQTDKGGPGDAAVDYKIYLSGYLSDDEKTKSVAQEAVQKAYSSNKDNLWLLRTCLLVQAETKSPLLKRVLTQAEESLAPFATRFEKLHNIDIIGAVKDAYKQVTEDNYTGARAVANLLFAEVATKMDQRRVDKNLLEYVLVGFSDEFNRKAAEAGAFDTEHPVPVTFAQGEPLADLSDIRAVQSIDFDLDGTPDVVAVGQKTVSVLSRDAEQNWTTVAQWEAPGELTGCVVADLDRDFDTKLRSADDPSQLDTDFDLVVYGPAGIFVLENVREDDKRSLRATDQSAGLADLKNISTALVIDIEHDGDLDIMLGDDTKVTTWTNNGKFRFELNPRVRANDLPNVTSLTPYFWDEDIMLDVLATTDDANLMGTFMNERHGLLISINMSSTFRWSVKGATVVGDFNNNNLSEIVCATDEDLRHVRFDQAEAGQLMTKLDKAPYSGVLTFDYDNDGFEDIAGWGPSGLKIFRATPIGFDATDLGSDSDAAVDSVVPADLDADGDLDLIFASGGKIFPLINNGGNANNSVTLTLRAEPNPEQSPANRVNMHGVGSLLECRVDGHFQKKLVTGPKIHVGLGQYDHLDALRLTWTDGVPQNVIQPDLSQPIFAQQDLKGSCPYLYTWNGERFEFQTDLLWAAPLGLQTAEWQLMPWREWEYLKIDHDQLRPLDGKYRLQITEELWEAAYFDQVRLIAVDHPQDVQIFSNEKVGPASIAEHKIHTVAQPHYPVRATNQRGEDVLTVIAKRDGKYLRSFDSRIVQGVTPPHFLELDPGPLKDPKSIKLVLTGWMFPTDTSLNVAISQNPDLNPPKPPSIQVRNENGDWIEAIPFCGFPGGKTKTIVIDLSDVFPTSNYAVRIPTTMQICWDEAFFSIDEGEHDVQVTELPMLSADLHYRGFSAMQKGEYNGPEQFDYSRVRTDPKWAPMRGKFTRYGNVKSLLTARDDLLVVMGSGDEMTLDFAADESTLPAGWTRDFLIYNVGWDKDADLNTISGQTSEPLPFQNIKQYPPVKTTRPASNGYDDYLREFQTREQSWTRFSNLLKNQATPQAP